MPSASMLGGQDEFSDSGEKLDAKIIGDYVVEGNVGQGSYGKVKLAAHKTTGQKVKKTKQKPLYNKTKLPKKKVSNSNSPTRILKNYKTKQSESISNSQFKSCNFKTNRVITIEFTHQLFDLTHCAF